MACLIEHNLCYDFADILNSTTNILDSHINIENMNLMNKDGFIKRAQFSMRLMHS